MAQQTALSVLGTPGQTQSFVAKTVAPEPEIIAVAVGTGKWKKKGKPRLPDPISFRKRQQEWKAHVAEAEVRMSQIHTDAGKARREAIESERPKESVESQRARTRQHKKPGLKIQRPKFERQDKPQSHEPQRKFLNPQQRKQADAQAAEQAKQQAIVVEKRAAIEQKIEKDVAAEEMARVGVIDKLISEELAEARIANSKRRKTSLVNLELAREAKKKARAAKKRKAKRKKK